MLCNVELEHFDDCSVESLALVVGIGMIGGCNTLVHCIG